MFDSVYILIPAYNEAQIIERVINDVKKVFKNILVVDDGSTDNTIFILKKNGILYLHHDINVGQGAAISTGIEYISKFTNASAIITFDADGQHNVNDAKFFAEEIIKNEYDIIFGTRFAKINNQIPFIKKIVLLFATKLTNYFTKTNLSDTHNGLKAMRRSFFEKVDITIDSYAFESQLILFAGKNRMRYSEMTTNTIYSDYSKKKGQSIFNMFKIAEDILTLILSRK